MVDNHTELNNDDNAMDESEAKMVENMVKEIHESMKARGYSAGAGMETQFDLTKEKPLVNVFKKVFGNGKDVTRSYRKLSRRGNNLKGRKKENKKVNIILDTSGSLYNELDQYVSQVIGNYDCFIVMCDTSVTFAQDVKSMKEWKSIPKTGGGGTMLQPALDELVKQNRQNMQTIFVSDFYCETLDLSKIKAPVTFVKTKNSTVHAGLHD